MKNRFQLRFLHPGILIVIAIFIALVMIAVAYFEMKHSKKLIHELMYEKGVALIEQVDHGASLSVRAVEQLELELEKRLLAAARSTAMFEKNGKITKEMLASLVQQHDLKTLHLVNNQGHIELSNHQAEHFEDASSIDFRDLFPELFDGSEKETFLGLHTTRDGTGFRYSAAVCRLHGGIVVASMDASILTGFLKSFGLGRFIQDMGKVSGVLYAVIQDNEGIIASTPNVKQLESLESNAFLLSAIENDDPSSRSKIYEGQEIFEIVKHIIVSNDIDGLVRIAFDAHEMRELEQKATRRVISIFLTIILLLSIAINALVIYHHLKISRLRRDEVVTLSDAVLEGLHDAVFVFSSEGSIRMMNNQARSLFGDRIEMFPEQLTGHIAQSRDLDHPHVDELVLPDINNRERTIVVGSSRVFVPTEEQPFVVMICHDVTEKRQLEHQMRQNEKIVSMGKLAGTVAHEVRNPLNAIGMAMQHLSIELHDVAQQQKIQRLLYIVTEEINRLNDIISQFLQFARAPVIELHRDDMVASINDAVAKVKELASSKHIEIEVQTPRVCLFAFDKIQMNHVLLNLLTNALDAIQQEGTVYITLQEKEDEIIISVKDSGRGMTADELSRVFDLYYTTKERGVGLGMAIAMHIVQAHQGTIKLDSLPGQGTTVYIQLPKRNV